MKPANPRKKIVIVTGASAGLGSEFARQVEQAYYADEIWLIARREGPMRSIAESFRKMRPEIIAMDLSNQDDIKRFEKKLNAENPIVHLLINNAGFGKIGPFEDIALAEQLNMIDLNCRALVQLTGLCLPLMEKGSAIIQVASSIGFFPAPLFSIYAATKSFVVSFSESLHFELKDKGIHVLAVCPGPVATEFISVAQKTSFMIDKVTKLETYSDKLMADAKSVVEQALADLDRKKRYSIYGFPIRVFVAIVPFLPKRFVLSMIAKRNKVRA